MSPLINAKHKVNRERNTNNSGKKNKKPNETVPEMQCSIKRSTRYSLTKSILNLVYERLFYYYLSYLQVAASCGVVHGGRRSPGPAVFVADAGVPHA